MILFELPYIGIKRLNRIKHDWTGFNEIEHN